jgi:hypothetical protein
MAILAWDVTADDIQVVANAHGVVLTAEHAEELLDEMDCDEIVSNLLSYTDFDDQCASMYDDIENFLLNKQEVLGEKVYPAP